MSQTIASRSKINLYLKVRKRRNDGYHELETFFLPLDAPADRLMLEFSDAPVLRVKTSLPGLPEDLDNLAGRAALAYAERTGIIPAWSIHIEKVIPVAAGMGGGSSNAAAVLRMLNDHYQKLTEIELAQLALGLGADVPFFLNARPTVATGIGEQFRYPEGDFTTPAILIVNPQFPVSAKWAYQHLKPEQIGEDNSGKLENIITALRNNDPGAIAKNLHNDLAPALYEKFPLLSILRDFMLNHGALNAEITGSGPSLFAVCADSEARERLRNSLLRAFESVVVF